MFGCLRTLKSWFDGGRADRILTVVDRANKEMAAGRYAAAVGELEAALRQYPGVPLLLSLRSQAHAFLGDFEAALADADRACQSAPREAEFRARRAAVRLSSRDKQGAIEDIEAAQAARPKDPRVLEVIGLANHGCGRFPEAIAAFTAALEHTLGSPLLHVLRGNSYRRAGRLDAALQDFGRALELDAGLAEAHAYRARVHLALKDEPAALRDLARALELDPQCHPALILRAGVSARARDYAGALKDYEAAVAVLPTSVNSHTGVGMMCLRLGDHARALSAFEQALHLSKSSMIANLGYAEVHAARGDWASTLPYLETAFQVADQRRTQAWCLYYCGLAAHMTGDPARATKDLARAVDLAADYPDGTDRAYFNACVHALMAALSPARAETLLVKAREFLQEALKDQRNVVSARHDSDAVLLRKDLVCAALISAAP